MNNTPTLHPADASAQPAPAKAPSRRVTDAPTRMFHWLFALCFAGAYATADGEHWRLLHVTLGYTMAGLLGFRLLYGIFGPRTSGLGLLGRKLAGAPAWLRSLPQATSVTQINWRQGQNLLMALAIMLLLALVVPLTLSGYATYNDWGAALGGNGMGEAMEEVHEFFGNALLLVVLAHIALIAGLSVLRRKNQALPMLTGRVEGKGPDLVNKNRTWLAALLLIATLAFGAWQWQQSPSGWVANGTSTERQRHHDDD